MAEVDGLRALEVRVARHRPVDVRLGAREQHLDQRRERDVRASRRLAHEQRDVGRDLVVARARGVQRAADRADELGQAALDRHVDVLVVGREARSARRELLPTTARGPPAARRARPRR